MKNLTLKKIILLLTVIVTCITIPVALYFTLGGQQTNHKSKTIDLNAEKMSYLAKVQHMNSITEQEAITITSDIEKNITIKMDNLHLEKDVDYKINNLETIKKDTHLETIHIIVTSTSTSTKAKGNFSLNINVQEDISDRSIPTITITAKEANGLSESRAFTIKSKIIVSVDTVLNESQRNEKDVDYQIINIDLIKTGAQFTDYNTKISVIGTSTKVVKSFAITFTLNNNIMNI